MLQLQQGKEKGSGAQLAGQRWDKAFGDNAAMVEELVGQRWNKAFGGNASMLEEVPSGGSLGSPSVFGLCQHQLAEMRGVLHAFSRVHRAAGGTAAEEGVALLDLCQRVIMVVLNEIKLRKEGGLPRNMPWVIAQLRYAMDDVAIFVESLVHESSLQRVLYKLGVVGTTPQREQFEQYDVTLRGILAVVKSRDALPSLSMALSSTDTAPPIPEEPKDSPALPKPWDAYDVAQSLHDFAEQLGRRRVRAVPGVEVLTSRLKLTRVATSSATKERLAMLTLCKLGGVGPSTREHLQQLPCDALLSTPVFRFLLRSS